MKLTQLSRRQLLLTCGATLGSSSLTLSTSALASAKGHGKTVTAEQTDWGIAGDKKKVTRTVDIIALDTMRFSPDSVSIKQGETIRFVLKNNGKMRHEMVLGTPKVLLEHAAMMIKFPKMEHDQPYMVHVNPGKKGEIIWHCNRAGEFEYACLIAGHYQAGMKGRLIISAA